MSFNPLETGLSLSAHRLTSTKGTMEWERCRTNVQDTVLPWMVFMPGPAINCVVMLVIVWVLSPATGTERALNANLYPGSRYGHTMIVCPDMDTLL